MELNITASNPLDFMKVYNLISCEFHKFIESNKDTYISAEYGVNRGLKIKLESSNIKIYNLVNFIPSMICIEDSNELELIYERRVKIQNEINSFIVTYINRNKNNRFNLEIEDESNCRENN